MSPTLAGQRCVSESEPELGLGRVACIDAAGKRIAVEFPGSGEKRLYALGTAVLKRVQFRPGETVTAQDGSALAIEAVEEQEGLLVYVGGGRRLPESLISDATSVASPEERLLAAQTDPSEVFDLRYRARLMQARLRRSPVRGYLGGRVELIPHQYFILDQVSSRLVPRVLLADEVGLGKTIEACLILQRLLAIGQIRRALILVPESLTHQWFVELLRRFNLWFSIYDEARCVAVEASEPGKNPFLAAQLVLANLEFLSGSEERGREAIAAGWDLVIVDEAHHLSWEPGRPSPEYQLVEALAERAPGLLLLTATPTQLGQAGHFARLRLLDRERYQDFESFVAQAEKFATVASVAGKIVDGRPLNARDRAALQRLFNRTPQRLEEHLTALAAGRAGACESLLRTLLDQHGIGRVMFRNTRASMAGFPRRRFMPARLETPEHPALASRIARELLAEETGEEAGLRYNFRDDPKLDWLVNFLREHSGGAESPGSRGHSAIPPAGPKATKVLLICRTQRKAIALETALQERMKAKSALFHEGLPLVVRDRHAAWFADPDGAQLLICSEIGSEGRNFQFAHHLVLFDLPLNPGLVEQRIGRLDRIGQSETIRIHVPYVAGTAEAIVVDWYARGLTAFERPLHGGTEYVEAFKPRLLALIGARGGAGDAAVEVLVGETARFREELDARMRAGRDRLLELNSFDPTAAAEVIERVRAAEDDPALREFLFSVLDHFGVRIREHEGHEVFFDPAHAYVESFPSLPADGLLATFDRQHALSREHIAFVSADHPLVGDAIELLLDSPAGTTAFGTARAARPNLMLEAVYVLEAVADTTWHVDQFLAPTPVRVVVGLRGEDLTAERDPSSLAGYVEDGDLHAFLAQPGFDGAVLRRLLGSAGAQAARLAERSQAAAAKAAGEKLGAALRRLVDLQQVNDHVTAVEIAAARERMERTLGAIREARLRLDALRLVLETPAR